MRHHLHIDPFSGVAGDMFLGALTDLGVDPDEIQAALAPLDLRPAYRIRTRRVQRHGIGAVDLRVELEDGHTNPGAPTHTHDHGGSVPTPTHPHGHAHPHVGYAAIIGMIDRLELPPRARDRARRVVTLLGEAEARVHQKPLEQVHFHEVGAVDSIVDLLGTVIALEQLGIDTLSCGPLPMGRGFVRCAHGLMPLPAPATACLLEGLPTIGVDRTGELVTPTGAALVAGLCERFGPPPAMTLTGVGYGAGDREDPDVPNLLRLLRGTRGGETRDAGPPPPPAPATDVAPAPAPAP